VKVRYAILLPFHPMHCSHSAKRPDQAVVPICRGHSFQPHFAIMEKTQASYPLLIATYKERDP
jgi:hypothetical protein